MSEASTQADFRLLKSRVTIASILNRYGITIRQQGREWRGSCPFCKQATDKKSSQRAFAVNPDKQTYYCHACKKGGDIIKFVAESEGCTLKEAGLKILDWFSYLFRDLPEDASLSASADTEGSDELEETPPLTTPTAPLNHSAHHPLTTGDDAPALLQQILLAIGGIHVEVSYIRQYLKNRQC